MTTPISTTPSSTTTPTAISPTTRGRWARALERTAIISAYAGTILVPTGFGKVALAPIALTFIATLAAPAVRRLWWAASGFAVVAAIPFTQYLLNPNRAPSLSKDMSPLWWVVIPAVGIVYIAAYHVVRRSVRQSAAAPIPAAPIAAAAS